MRAERRADRISATDRKMSACCEEASHALLCVLGCLGCKQYVDRFKIEPTWAYFLSLFWPVLDMTGDTLFLLTELLNADTRLALAGGLVPWEVVVTLSVLSIVFSLALWCWRVGHLRRMHKVGYDLTEREDVVDDEDEVSERKQTMNPLNSDKKASTATAGVDYMQEWEMLKEGANAELAAFVERLLDAKTARGRKDTAYVLERDNLRKMKDNAELVAKLVKGERERERNRRERDEKQA